MCDMSPHNVSFFRKYVRVVLNQFVWEISRVQKRAKPSEDEGDDLSTKR